MGPLFLPVFPKRVLWLTVAYKVNHSLILWHSSSNFRCLPKIRKTCVHRKTCTWMFKAALFIFPPNWNQLNCPPRNERINKLRYICTTEYYSTIQTVDYGFITWMTLKTSLDRKGYDCILPFIWSSRIGKDWKRLWRSFQGSWKCSVSPKCLLHR